MEPARADREGRADEPKSKGIDSTTPAAKSGTKSSKRIKLSMDVGKKEAAVRRIPSGVASNASRRGSISMLAHQLRMLEAQKEGEVRYVAGFSCTDIFQYYNTHFWLVNDCLRFNQQPRTFGTIAFVGRRRRSYTQTRGGVFVRVVAYTLDDQLRERGGKRGAKRGVGVDGLTVYYGLHLVKLRT